MTTLPITDALPSVKLNSPDGAQAKICLHGGHLVSWRTPDGYERLFLSGRSEFHPGAAIRGGVPVIFPQFAGLGPLSKHGFARNLSWRHLDTEEDSKGSMVARFRLNDSDETRRLWDYGFQLDLAVRIGGTLLEMRLQITNTGMQPFTCMAALHTYLRVNDIAGVIIEGLEGLTYKQFGVEGVQAEPRLHIAGEIDRIYWRVSSPIVLRDGAHTLRVTADGFPDAVIWNPGPEKAPLLPDLDHYQQMLCIEAAAIGQLPALAPGDTWRGTQLIEVL